MVEELDPFLLAAVDATNKVRYQPRIRYDRTLRYFATVAFGDSRSAIKASEILVKVHAKAVGIEPISGKTYDANDPDSQLWIHLTAWHSILYAYERYGPGRLSPEDEARYWEECAVAAELQTCDPDARARARARGSASTSSAMRPRLAASEAAQAMMDHLLNAEVMFPPLPWIARPGAWVVNQVLRRGDDRDDAALDARSSRACASPRIVDALIRPLMRVNFALVALSSRVQVALLGLISPATRPVAEPVLRGIPPRAAGDADPGRGPRALRRADAARDLRPAADAAGSGRGVAVSRIRRSRVRSCGRAGRRRPSA